MKRAERESVIKTKKILASVGLVAMGAMQLRAENVAGLAQTRKAWTISATLRTFYDDNIFTSPDNSHTAISSFGFDLHEFDDVELMMRKLLAHS